MRAYHAKNFKTARNFILEVFKGAEQSKALKCGACSSKIAFQAAKNFRKTSLVRKNFWREGVVGGAHASFSPLGTTRLLS